MTENERAFQGARQVHTIEKTSKVWKGLHVLSLLGLLAGIGILIVVFLRQDSPAGLFIGVVLSLGSLALNVFARFMAWWFHG